MNNQILQIRLGIFLFTLFMTATVIAQNVGIGTTNPQKGRLEITGALGGHTTVLTIGSDGTGISLQRNWPTIGLNQYRDASNIQRFIGAGYAGSIFLSQDDGGLVFAQFGQGTANQEITNTTYPLYITGFGTTVLNGALRLKNTAYAEKEIVFEPAAKIVSTSSGILRNLTAFAYGFVTADGAKFRGTDNFTCVYNQSLQGYSIYFTEDGDNAQLIVTPRSTSACYATYHRFSQGVFMVFVWNSAGVKIKEGFSITVFQ